MHLVDRHHRPRRVVARTIALGMGALLAAGFLTWTPASVSAWNQASAEATLWQLLNGARTNNGMAPLQQHSTLVGLARWRSSDMLAKNYFSHTIPGCGCLVYAYYDSNGLAYDWAGENIGWNSGLDDSYSPVRVHEKFMSSPNHRANVLYAAFTHGGVGAAAANNQMYQGSVQNTRMYTQLFLQAPAAAPRPAPPPPPPPAPAPAPPPPAPGAPAPAPAAPSGGDGGGGTGSTAPAQQAAQVQPAAQAPAQAPKAEPRPQPRPKRVAMEAPVRPASAAGLDGTKVVVSAPGHADLAGRHLAEETARVRVAEFTAVADEAEAVAGGPNLEVKAEPAAQPGLLESVVGAVIGFLFG